MNMFSFYSENSSSMVTLERKNDLVMMGNTHYTEEEEEKQKYKKSRGQAEEEEVVFLSHNIYKYVTSNHSDVMWSLFFFTSLTRTLHDHFASSRLV